MSVLGSIRWIAGLGILFAAAPAIGQQILVNEFYRDGTLGTGNEWIEVVLLTSMTPAQLDTYFVGDSQSATSSKFSGYRFTSMASIAPTFPAGTIIVVSGTAGPASDTLYDPANNDWNITLRTGSANLTSNGSTGDLGATDVVYVDTNGTNGDATLSSNGFAVNWDNTPGAFGAVASVLIAVPANATGAVLSTGLAGATTPASWTTSVAPGSLTPGQPNPGVNSTYILGLRASETAPSVTSTTPVDNATGIAIASNIDVTFSEAVDVATNGFTISCATSGAHTAAVTGGPTTFTLNPDTDFANGELCTVTVDAASVTDQDAIDPPDEMVANHVFDFTTVSLAPTLAIANVTALEGTGGTGNFSFQVTLTNAASGPFTVDFATADGSATSPADYANTTGTLNFAGNDDERQFANVTVVGDADVEPDQTFTVTLSNVQGASVAITTPTGTGTLVNDDFPPPNLTIADVTSTEGHAGTKIFAVVATLDSDPGTNTVSFDLTTADDSATVAGDDYEFATRSCSLTGTTRTCTLDVTVNGDLVVEPNESFFVNVTNLSGVGTSDVQAIGTITNDDVAATPIGEIQGMGDVSPRAGETLTVIGIVTARATGGFWVQDAGDGDPNTSDGIYVFRSGHTAQVGNLVRVTGQVSEFFHLTELSPTLANIVLLDAGPLTLPTPVTISSSSNTPSTAYPSNLERFENMRVTIPDFTVTAPNRNKNSGEFYGVVTGMARPFREPGIEVEATLPNPPPTIPYAGPRFDNNPELLSVNPQGQTGGTALLVSAGTRIDGGITGVMDYSFEKYRVLPDPATLTIDDIDETTIPTGTSVAATDVAGGEFTIAAFNVQLLEEINAACTGTTGTCRKLRKVSMAIRDSLKLPDVVALIELGDFNGDSPTDDVPAGPVLEALAARVNADAVAASLPNPQYVGVLTEAAEDETQATGFLIKTATLGSNPRVALDGIATDAVKEYGRVDGADGLDNKMYCPNGVTPIANGRLIDRAPLALKARITAANGDVFPITVLNLHLKSLSSVDSNEANTSDADGGPERYSCASGTPFATLGERYRAKRQQGAEFVARLVQKLQTESPQARLLVVGDLNAYEFNDGYADVLATIRGETYDGTDGPYADNLTIVPGDGADLVTRNLADLYVFSPPSQWYSYTFDGHAQQIDHELANDQLLLHADPVRVERPRINADFGLIHEDDVNTPLRSSDHDPVVGFFRGVGFGTDPTISAVADQSTPEDTATAPIAFTISNAIGCVESVTVGAVPSLASAAVTGDATACAVVLTPASGVTGDVAVTLTVTDPDGDTDQSAFTLDVEPGETGSAVANDDTATVDEDSEDNSIAVLVNDVADPDDGTLGILSVGSAMHGGAQIGGGGDILYTPNPNYCGSDSFTYTVNGGDTATVGVTVTCIDDGSAMAVSDLATVDEDSADNVVPVLVNDAADPDTPSTAPVVANVGSAANGTAALLPSGEVTYTPDPNYCGNDGFSYTLVGGSTAQVTVSVTCINDAPTISAIADVSVAVDVTGQASFTIADVDDTLTCTSTHLGATSLNPALLPEASIVFSGTAPNCTATLTPVAGQTGDADVIITVTDGPADAQRQFRFTVSGELIFEDGFED